MCSSKEFQLAAVELMYLKCKEKINLKKKKTQKLQVIVLFTWFIYNELGASA